MTPTLRRYVRHTVLPEIGEGGQEKLLASSALVIGCGGLGAAASASLVAMGVGTVGICDFDRVELSNLNRQTLYESGDIGRLKVEAARDRLEEINPDITITPHPLRLEAENAAHIVQDYDLIVDGSDNFATRITLHEACYHAKKPLVLAAISGFAAQISTFKAYLGNPHPCYRCFLAAIPNIERNCAQEGIIGALAGMIGHMQALEAVKELLGIGDSLSGRLLRYEALKAEWKESRLMRDAECGLCSRG